MPPIVCRRAAVVGASGRSSRFGVGPVLDRGMGSWQTPVSLARLVLARHCGFDSRGGHRDRPTRPRQIELVRRQTATRVVARAGEVDASRGLVLVLGLPHEQLKRVGGARRVRPRTSAAGRGTQAQAGDRRPSRVERPGRRPLRHEDHPIDLSYANLSGAVLTNARLSGADLSHCLHRQRLPRRQLRGL